MSSSKQSIIQKMNMMPGKNIAFTIENGVGKVVFYSDEISKLFGMTEAEYKATDNLLDLVFEEDKGIVIKSIKERLNQPGLIKEEFLFRAVNKNTGFVWVHVCISKIIEENGNVIFAANVIDVTHEMENSYTLMENSDRAVCVIEKATKRFLYANNRFYKMIGSSESKSKGKRCYEILCKSLEMKTNDNCLCYSSINSKDPIETYNPLNKTYIRMSGKPIKWGEYDSYVFYLTDVTKDKEKDELLEDSIRRFNIALDNSNIMVWEYDMVNNLCINSEKAGRDYNIPIVIENYPESLFTTGHTPPETIEQIKDCKRRLFNGESGFSVERRTIDKYGKSQWQKVSYVLQCDENNKPLRAIVCGVDITAKKQIEKKYEEQKAYRNNLAKKAMFSIRLDLDANEMLDYTCTNPKIEFLVNKSRNVAEFLSNFFATSIFNPDSEISRESLTLESLQQNYLMGQGQYQTMYQCSMLNKFLEMSITISKNPISDHVEAFLIVLDVTDNAFMHDNLTGLYNRQKSYLECNRILDEHPNEKMVMMRFDIQRFRLYNTFFGESEGDKLLQYIANMFRDIAKTQPYGVFGRIESDVFLLFFPYKEETFVENQKLIHDKLINYRDDFQIAGNCGVYIMKDRKFQVDEMFNRATLAAKNNHNKQMQPILIFDEKMEIKLNTEQQISKEMRHALKNHEFKVYIQPKFCIDSDKAKGGEALVRWLHPKEGIISPNNFIPLFESNGFIISLDRYMWEEVCILLRKWINEGKKPDPVSVNVSRVSMYSPQTVPFLVNLIKKYDIKPKLFNLELTESAYMEDPDEMKKRLLELKSYGFEIMMDDFGSGYSSLNTLREIPVDYIKVDRMFLASIDHDERSRVVLSSVIGMATGMGMPVITEGVETEAQKEFLKGLNCDYAQGFLYAKPMPAEVYEEKYVK